MSLNVRERPFRQVDVFTAVPYQGNPLAVVHDGTGLTDLQMQAFANWTNLSETTFLLPPADPAADYQVRIFTTVRELPFAGHPTLGSCHAWLEAGGQSKSAEYVIQQCKAGLVKIRRLPSGLAFAAPPTLRSGPLTDGELDLACKGLKITRNDIVAHQWVDNGPGWAAVMLRSARDVLALTPDLTLTPSLKVGVVGAHEAGHPSQFEVRAFLVTTQPLEDPVTGSLNASLGQWLIGAGLAPERYRASQGTALGRAGVVQVERDSSGQVWVGGDSVTCVRGGVSL